MPRHVAADFSANIFQPLNCYHQLLLLWRINFWQNVFNCCEIGTYWECQKCMRARLIKYVCSFLPTLFAINFEALLYLARLLFSIWQFQFSYGEARAHPVAILSFLYVKDTYVARHFFMIFFAFRFLHCFYSSRRSLL